MPLTTLPDPTEIKILVITVFGSMAFDFEILLKFIVPLLSAATWFFVKPLLIKLKRKYFFIK